MRLIKSWLCGLSVVLAACSTTFAPDVEKPKDDADPAKVRTTRKPRQPGWAEYDRMAKVLLDLTDKQKTQLRARIAAKHETLIRNRRRYDEVQALRKKHKEALAGGNKDAARALKAKIQAIGDQQRKLMDKLQADVLAVLSADQRNVWQAYLLQRWILQRIRPAKPGDDQAANIKQLCEDAAEEMAHLARLRDKARAEKARKDIRAKLVEKIWQQVLTAEQRESIEKRRAKEKKRRAERLAKRRAAERGASRADDQPKTGTE